LKNINFEQMVKFIQAQHIKSIESIFDSCFMLIQKLQPELENYIMTSFSLALFKCESMKLRLSACGYWPANRWQRSATLFKEQAMVQIY
jgi:hypothetical protein